MRDRASVAAGLVRRPPCRAVSRLLLRRLGTLLWCFAGTALLSGCARGPLEPELLRRHASLRPAEAPGRVTVTVHAAPLAADFEGPRLFRLSKSAQSELIESLAARTATVDALLAALDAPVRPDPGRSSADAGLRFLRRIVVSAEPRDFGPADRIARLRVVLTLDTAEARFAGWDRFVTEHGTVEVGELALQRDREAGLDLDLVPDVGGASDARAAVIVGGSTRLEEAVHVADPTLSTGVLHPDSMVLLQRGAVGRDLAGNSVLAVTVEAVASGSVTLHDLHGLFDGQGRPGTATEVRAVPRRVAVPLPLPRGIRARLRFEARSRTVVPGRGDGTFPEGDDHVRMLRTVGAGREVTLVPASELRTSAWQLVDSDCRRALHLAGAASRPAVLLLGRHEEADRLRRWLAATVSGRLGAHRLYLGDEPLRPAEAPLLRVRLLPLNWDAGADGACA